MARCQWRGSSSRGSPSPPNRYLTAGVRGFVGLRVEIFTPQWDGDAGAAPTHLVRIAQLLR